MPWEKASSRGLGFICCGLPERSGAGPVSPPKSALCYFYWVAHQQERRPFGLWWQVSEKQRQSSGVRVALSLCDPTGQMQVSRCRPLPHRVCHSGAKCCCGINTPPPSQAGQVMEEPKTNMAKLSRLGTSQGGTGSGPEPPLSPAVSS